MNPPDGRPGRSFRPFNPDCRLNLAYLSLSLSLSLTSRHTNADDMNDVGPLFCALYSESP